MSDHRNFPNVVFVLGGPGAGKGTMCELAETQLGWTHLSTGDLLRAEREAGGPTAKVIEEYMTSGRLVPNEITVTPTNSPTIRTSTLKSCPISASSTSPFDRYGSTRFSAVPASESRTTGTNAPI